MSPCDAWLHDNAAQKGRLQMRTGSCVRVFLACLALTGCSDDEDPEPIDRIDGGGDAGPDANVDAKVDGSSPDSSLPICGVSQKYSFRWDGGLTPDGQARYEVENVLLRKTLTPHAMSDAGPQSCTRLISCNQPGVDAVEVEAAFNNADVRAAFTDANVVLGVDDRAVDNSVLIIERADGKKLQIGTVCGSKPNCTPIPAGVETLRTTLVTLLNEQSTTPDGGVPTFCPAS
jgi:hypothetical protein